MALALRHNRAYNGEEIIVERPDGERRTVLAYANPVYDEAGTLLGAVNVLADITERNQIEQQLRRSERELNDFFENATIGLHWVGPDGIILRANRAELELLGYTAEEYVGRHIAAFHADPDAIADMLCRLQAGEELHSYEARLRCKDGSVRHVVISSNVLREGGRFVHTRCFTRDITERKRAEEALREANRRKDEFLAMLAHELRNPLAPVRVAVQLLQMQQPESSHSREALAVIDRQMRQMTRLIDDLLDVSRITRGKLELRRQRAKLADVVRAAVETSRPALDAAGHTLTVELPAEPIELDADPTRLAQAVANLLNNAARYTDRGGQVRLELERQGSDAVITVRDTGIGIPAEMLGHVFEMFTQVDRSLERVHGGLGIGLTLVKSLVELHGGSVQAHSDGPGTGSTFTIRLPLPLVSRETESSAGGAPALDFVSRLTGDTPLRVLVVDDNRDAADTLAILLQMQGAEVRAAHDGREAVEAAEVFHPDAVILDIGMPRLNGYDAARRIRQLPGGSDVVLIAATGWGQDGDKQLAREAGFDHHLVKPVDPAALLQLLGSLKRVPV
jgi:PAS domain S-box-containing protein